MCLSFCCYQKRDCPSILACLHRDHQVEMRPLAWVLIQCGWGTIRKRKFRHKDIHRGRPSEDTGKTLSSLCQGQQLPKGRVLPTPWLPACRAGGLCASVMSLGLQSFVIEALAGNPPSLPTLPDVKVVGGLESGGWWWWEEAEHMPLFPKPWNSDSPMLGKRRVGWQLAEMKITYKVGTCRSTHLKMTWEVRKRW